MSDFQRPISFRSASRSLASALDFIQQDIEAHRELPYDEDRERARLRPV